MFGSPNFRLNPLGWAKFDNYEQNYNKLRNYFPELQRNGSITLKKEIRKTLLPYVKTVDLQ